MIEEQAADAGESLPRRVPVHGGPDSDAAVVVRAVHGAVWMSITPPVPGDRAGKPLSVPRPCTDVEGTVSW